MLSQPTIITRTPWKSRGQWWSICLAPECGGMNSGPWQTRRTASWSSLLHLKRHHPGRWKAGRRRPLWL